MARGQHLSTLTVWLSLVAIVYGQAPQPASGDVLSSVFSNDTPSPTSIQSQLPSYFSSIPSTPSPVTIAPNSADESMSPHISTSVALVAGILSGMIAILAAVLILVVISTRRRKDRRMLHEMIHHSGAAFGNEEGWSPQHGRTRRLSGSSSTCCSPSKPYFQYISSPSELSAHKYAPDPSAKNHRGNAISDLGLAPSLSSRSNSSMGSPGTLVGDMPPAYIKHSGDI